MRAMDRGAIVHTASVSAQHGNLGSGVITLVQLNIRCRNGRGPLPASVLEVAN